MSVLYIAYINRLQDTRRKCHPCTYRFLDHMIPICPVFRKCDRHTEFPVYRNVPKMWPVLLFNIFIVKEICVLVTGNVSEISCVLAQEICPKFCPLLFQEISRFPGVGNVHAMNKKCELSCTFHRILLPRKFRILPVYICV